MELVMIVKQVVLLMVHAVGFHFFTFTLGSCVGDDLVLYWGVF
jgi:hypothetical protein